MEKNVRKLDEKLTEIDMKGEVAEQPLFILRTWGSKACSICIWPLRIKSKKKSELVCMTNQHQSREKQRLETKDLTSAWHAAEKFATPTVIWLIKHTTQSAQIRGQSFPSYFFPLIHSFHLIFLQYALAYCTLNALLPLMKWERELQEIGNDLKMLFLLTCLAFPGLNRIVLRQWTL